MQKDKTLVKTEQQKQPEKEILKPSKTLFEWETLERLFKTKSREFYRRLAVIIIFFSLLALVTKDIPLVLILGVSFFAVYVFHTIPPRKVTHKITTRGIDYASEYLYTWDSLVDFWIEEKEGHKLLNVTTKDALPGRIALILGKDMDAKKVVSTVNQYLSINEDPKKTAVDEVMSKITSKINLG